MSVRTWRRMCGLLLALSLISPAWAADLTIGVEAGPGSLDPHFHINQQNDMMAQHVFDALIRQDEHQRLVPGLAVSWQALDDTTWEFKLRPDVKWHDGTAFTADDVVFTMKRAPNVPNSPASYGEYLRHIAEVTAVDPLTVRFKTRTPFPLHPVYISNIQIVQKKAVESATTADFNSGKAMIGTGPYRFVEWAPGDHVTYKRNDEYWGGKEPWENVTVKAIPKGASRVAALLSGEVDMIDAVPPVDVARLKETRGVRVVQTASNRVILLNLDQDRDASPFVTGAGGERLDRNPLKDLKVRQALSKAISRPLLAERVMDGSAVPVGQLVPPALFGFNPELKPEPYDPEGAKRLLAAAGFPNGFGLTLHCPNDRYINDANVCQAIAQMLSRVGVRTAVDAMPKNIFFSRATNRDFSFFLTGWGSGTGEASLPLKTILHTYDKDHGYGAANRGRYSNPAFDRVLEEALGTLDDHKRSALLQKASALAAADVAVIPLYAEVNTWATREGVTYTPRTDGYTIATFAKPAK